MQFDNDRKHTPMPIDASARTTSLIPAATAILLTIAIFVIDAITALDVAVAAWRDRLPADLAGGTMQ